MSEPLIVAVPLFSDLGNLGLRQALANVSCEHDVVGKLAVVGGHGRIPLNW